MSNTKTILGFIAGASLGAIAGILMAPDSGSATRNKIIDRSGELKDAVKDSLLDFMDKLQPGGTSKMDIENLAEAGVHDTKSGEDKIREVMHHAKDYQS